MPVQAMDVSVCSDSQGTLEQLRTFIAGASRASDTNQLVLVQTAISLLKTLPAASEAVLEYFCTVFHNYVSRYLSLLENGTLTVTNSNESDVMVEEEIPLIEIQQVLCTFVNETPEAWAPIISTWSLELLGDISSRHGTNKQVSCLLNERLQLWTACEATRTLLDINTQCMSRLMYSNTEACINALLNMSVTHSPHFDWVVVHVGSSFPETVITKVLTCGLKDFCNNENSTQTPKLHSVVGILGHLASTHFTDIKNALKNLFQWSLEETDKATYDSKNIILQKTAAVPYLLRLAESPVLLKALSADTLQSLDVKTLISLSRVAADWRCYFSEGKQGLLDLVVRLLLDLEKGVNHILTMLFETASSPPELEAVSLNAQEIVELLISEMDMILRTTSSTPPLIRSFYSHMPFLKRLLLSENRSKSSYATRLFIVLGKYDNQLLSSCIAYLLNRATSDVQLEMLIELTTSLDNLKAFAYGFCLALEYESIENVVLFEEKNWSLTLWKNIETLLKYENRYNPPAKPILQGLMENFYKILDNLKAHHNDVTTSRIIASIINDLLSNISRPLSVEETMALADSVTLFFYCCIVYDKDDSSQLKGCQLANNLLVKCCSSSNRARNQTIKLVIETALYSPISLIFGATVKPDCDSLLPADASLLKENIKQGNTLMVAQSAMSVFHTGIIGGGLQEVVFRSTLSPEKIKLNTQHLMSAIRSCCLSDTNNVSLDAVRNIALLLVQLISPDVMFNGLPWPEEEFCKVTVERDLHIRKAFDNTPLLWTLLKFVAIHRPALCTCSVLLRAVTASLIAQWSSASQGRSVKHNGLLADTTVVLLEILSLGQLLPPPLSGIRDIVPKLSPQHMLIIMRECVWNYMRDHVPSPALFKEEKGIMWRDPALSKPTKQYTETLRIVLLNNIDKLGDLYHQLFAPIAMEID